MILSCHNISKSFGVESILENVSFLINEHEKAAIVGINGAGKSTLLKIIIGELTADTGEVIFAKGTTFGYLSQHQDLVSERSVYDEMLSVKAELLRKEQAMRKLEQDMKSAEGDALEQMLSSYTRLTHEFEQEDGYAYRSKVVGVLKGLGFTEEDFGKCIATLSGGQKTRLALGRLLLLNPDLILLDEPINHLDMNSIAWLETYLLNYSGAVIIVAHDRYFMDRIVTKVIELDNKQARMFTGNYSEYAEKKEQLRAIEIQHYLNQQREIKHQEEVIAKLRSFNREKSIKRAESREKMLDKIERLEKPTTVDSKMRLKLEPNITSGNDVLYAADLSKSFGEQELFRNVGLDIKRGERVAIIGGNGTGKTTLLKIITGLLEPDTGEIRTGVKVYVGYYDQEQQVLHSDKTIFDEIQDEYPYLTNTAVRNVLAAFLFTNDDAFKLVKDLSGGERGRVSLAKLMLSEANFLILDEPTNHLDIVSKEILENALNSYTGTILFVSHDRYFINKTATRILDLTRGTLVNYRGNYDYYLEKKEQTEAVVFGQASVTGNRNSSGAAGSKTNAGSNTTVSSGSSSTGNSHGQGSASNAGSAANTSEISSGRDDWQKKKEEQARERKRKSDLEKVEKQIHLLESEDAEIDEKLTDEAYYTDPHKLVELNKRKQEIAKQLESLMEQWEELM